MNLYHKNPRTITREQYASLEQWLEELGDLGGVVHNLPTDEIIAANQRMRVFGLDEAKVTLTERYDKPDDQGTVAWGYVEWRGHRYSYRAVAWDEKTCEQANIVANKAGGDWDWDVLANEWNADDLLEWGFERYELGFLAVEEINYEELWEGMPEFEQEDLSPFRSIKVHFRNADDVTKFAKMVEQKVTDKTKSIWYPKAEIGHMDKVYKDES